MTAFDPNQVLSNDQKFPPIATHLYRVGLHMRLATKEKRKRLHNPILIFVFLSIQVTKFYLFIQSYGNNESLSIKLGNIAYFFKMNIVYNLGSNLYYQLAIYSIAVYYFNYRTGESYQLNDHYHQFVDNRCEADIPVRFQRDGRSRASH